ncbi:MAG TPA: phosphatase PAP2/dual specificity phosphatase family protein [Thermoanaerobaculia bacterium]
MRAAAWLLFLGPFFFATYGFANWLASTRANVGVVVFDWERHIPFMPWTIIPYWSIDLLYAISLFVCTTRREVDRHAQRLLFAQLVSVACFIAFPLRFSFERPESSGLFGALFTALGSFDKPFNQAPSLHIALLIIVWVRLAAHVGTGFSPSGGLKPAPHLLHAWMALIGVSVLTTYQHHFLDLPTGAAVGFLALWIIPDEEESPLRRMSFTRDRKRVRLALLYATGAALCTAVAFLGGAWLWMLWPAAALAFVALIYAAIGERGFQKSANGQLSLGSRALLAPYLGAAWLNSRLWTRRHPDAAEVRDGVWIGRIPTKGEPFAAIVDLCAELSCASHPAYHNVPVLDLTRPSDDALRAAAQAIEGAPKPLLVCCALGYSRSARAVVEWLLTTRRAASFDEAAAIVRKARPSVVLHD